MTDEPSDRTSEPPRQGLLDTNILVLRRWVNLTELPDEMAISVITLAELSAGPHQVRPNSEQNRYNEHEERARRTEALQRAESEFDPIPFDAEAARIYGRVTAAVVTAGRKPRRRIADLMIAATAISEGLPLYTTNPGDYKGLEKHVRVVPVTRPPLPHEKRLAKGLPGAYPYGRQPRSLKDNGARMPRPNFRRWFGPRLFSLARHGISAPPGRRQCKAPSR